MTAIIDYHSGLKEHIRTLNYEWLEKYFRLEPGDVVALSDPQIHIIDKGGFIFYVSHNDEIVGVAALLKVTDAVYELGKMAVTEKYRNMKFGKLLIEHCIRFAETKGIEKLILYSNTKLAPAIHLYKKYGFVEIQLESGHYERADIKMEKQLKT